MTVFLDRIANKKKLQVRIIKYLMCIYGGHVHMNTKYEVSMSNHVPGGEVCTDDDADANTG